MSIKIVFFDVDGTLASNADHSLGFLERIPFSAKQAIHKLKENGVLVAIATGRSYASMKPFEDILEIDTLICSNGNIVIHHGAILDINVIPYELVVQAIHVLEGVCDLNIFVETSKGDYRIGPPKSDLSFMGDDLQTIHHIEDLKHYDVFQVIGNGYDVAQYVNHLDEKLTIRKFGPHAFDICLKDINKGVAVEHVLKKLGLTPDEAMAFGDEANDLEMFMSVKTSVAMQDSNEALKQVATHVTSSVESDGIVNGLKYFNLI
ncbi:hypothetical protein AOC36_09085 [Erysipelothrix larvae]|uniref:Hydrolase n=1 Tax=Erysipelothrix larvae TaxID=1514105 RepID=A0A0X8H137_9FIRM|nr:HAD family hydrolase [Erysipelothrix larvae]AMC94136.1 hypothetical protein AOC36_09085 [Erysipelothrix larvae]